MIMKNILFIITGSIAASRCVGIFELLYAKNFEISCILTKEAEKYIKTLNLLFKEYYAVFSPKRPYLLWYFSYDLPIGNGLFSALPDHGLVRTKIAVPWDPWSPGHWGPAPPGNAFCC